MKTALLWALLFAITVAETWIATWEGRADRQSTHCKTNKYSKIAAFWAGKFELILLADMWFVYREGWSIGVPIYVGAVWGKYVALEKRRARWRARVKKPRKPSPSSTGDGAS